MWTAARSLRFAALALLAQGFSHRLLAQAASNYPPPPDQSTGPIKVGGYIQARETYRDDTKLTATLNRARVFAEGNLAAGFTYRIMAEYEAASSPSTAAGVSLRDAYVRWTHRSLNVWAGQYKTPFSPQFITSITQIETADRATVVDSLATKRDIGVMGQYDFGNYLSLQGGVFNGQGQNRIVNVDSSSLVVGRVAVKPIAILTLGTNIAAYPSDSTRYGFDADAEYRGASLKGEFIWQDHKVDRPVDKGWYGLAAYRVLPWVQLVLMQESFRRDAISLARRVEATTGGINAWFAANRVRLLMNYVSRKIGTPGIRRGTLITQAQVRF